MDKINDELKKLELEIEDVKRRLQALPDGALSVPVMEITGNGTGTAGTGFPIFPKAPVPWPKNWLSENTFPFY